MARKGLRPAAIRRTSTRTDTGHPSALTPAATANVARSICRPGSAGSANKDRYTVVATEETPFACRLEAGSFGRDAYLRNEVAHLVISSGSSDELDFDGPGASRCGGREIECRSRLDAWRTWGTERRH